VRLPVVPEFPDTLPASLTGLHPEPIRVFMLLRVLLAVLCPGDWLEITEIIVRLVSIFVVQHGVVGKGTDIRLPQLPVEKIPVVILVVAPAIPAPPDRTPVVPCGESCNW